MANKKSWTNQELADFKDMIIKKKSQAEDDLEINKKRADDMMNSDHSNALYSSHMADASADHTDMERAYYFIAREQRFITYLDRALSMLDDGTFGVCKVCSKLISKERLEEVPHTKKCFDCKSSI